PGARVASDHREEPEMPAGLRDLRLVRRHEHGARTPGRKRLIDDVREQRAARVREERLARQPRRAAAHGHDHDSAPPPPRHHFTPANCVVCSNICRMRFLMWMKLSTFIPSTASFPGFDENGNVSTPSRVSSAISPFVLPFRLGSSGEIGAAYSKNFSLRMNA